MSNPGKFTEAGDGFPPPPPGPPLAQQQMPQQQMPQQQVPQQQVPHPEPVSTPLGQQHTPEIVYEQGRPQQQQPYQSHPDQQQQNYSIPPYQPAAPVFAPPPTDPIYAQQQPATDSAPLATAADGSQAPHKKGWGERFSKLGSVAAAPLNSLAHKLGSQSFLPESLDKECDKAAVTLKAFCTKGVYADPAAGQPPTSTDPSATVSSGAIIDPTKEKPKNRVLVTIPPRVISKALGLAIFTTLRAGFQVSGATGSGILIARLPDGSWGPPSGIQVHSVGGGFQIGLDIYDCVCVINSKEALAAFTDTRVSLGSDLTVVAGPYGAGGAVDFGMEKGKDKPADGSAAAAAAPSPAADSNLKPATDPKAKRRSLSVGRISPVFSYVKSRGFYAGIQVDGTVVVERKDANAAFYGDRVSVSQILSGHVPSAGPGGLWPQGAQGLLQTLRGAEAGVLKDEPVVVAPGAAAAAGGAVPAATASGALPVGSEPPHGAGFTEQTPPAYVDDGVHRPAVGDYKYQ